MAPALHSGAGRYVRKKNMCCVLHWFCDENKQFLEPLRGGATAPLKPTRLAPLARATSPGA
eukprot:10516170-Alexandrium_andersonii.AAC.1